jgi:hypothetical protein
VVQAQPPQVGEHDAGVLARDVGQDDVTVRLAGGRGQADDVDDRAAGLEELEDGSGLLGRR